LRGGNLEHVDLDAGTADGFSAGYSNVEQVQHPLTVPNGIDFVLTKIQEGVDATIGSIDLPLIGGFGSDASDFIDDIRSAIVDGLTEQLLVADASDTRTTAEI